VSSGRWSWIREEEDEGKGGGGGGGWLSSRPRNPHTRTHNPAGCASNGFRFLEDKKISLPLRRRFQFWLLCVLSVLPVTRGGGASGTICAGSPPSSMWRSRSSGIREEEDEGKGGVYELRVGYADCYSCSSAGSHMQPHAQHVAQAHTGTPVRHSRHKHKAAQATKAQNKTKEQKGFRQKGSHAQPHIGRHSQQPTAKQGAVKAQGRRTSTRHMQHARHSQEGRSRSTSSGAGAARRSDEC
jgi:hypothetical protein